MRIAVDVDEVCADLLTAWVARYNARWNDTLDVKDITAWDLRQFVKPECGSKIYDLLHEDNIYQEVKPIYGALQAVQRMRRDGHRVIFVSSCVVGTIDHKVRWLIDHKFLPDQNSQADFIAATDKFLIDCDILIDDRLDNVEMFLRHALLVDMPHNQDSTTRPRIKSIADAPHYVNQLVSGVRI